MEKLKHYPKLAIGSLVLLVVALLMFFLNWITVKQASFLNILASQIPGLSDGALSFAEGLSLVGQLNSFSSNVGTLVDTGKIGTFVTMLTVAYHILFWGSILSVIYCFYARLNWHSGLREGIYFLFFVGDIGIMYFLMNQFNKLFGAGTFGLAPWGIIAAVCALLSEILWEEASFNTPNPLQNITK